MTAREELRQELYEAFLKSFKEMGPKAKEMSWFWRSHFRLNKETKESRLPEAA